MGVVDCWAHQMNLVVGDLLKLKLPFLEAIPLSLEIVKWFNNHLFALDVFQKEQRLMYSGKVYLLILPALTHWTCHYLSSLCILKVMSSLQIVCIHYREELIMCVGKEKRLQEKTAEILAIQSFWANMIL